MPLLQIEPDQSGYVEGYGVQDVRAPPVGILAIQAVGNPGNVNPTRNIGDLKRGDLGIRELSDSAGDIRRRCGGIGYFRFPKRHFDDERRLQLHAAAGLVLRKASRLAVLERSVYLHGHVRAGYLLDAGARDTYVLAAVIHGNGEVTLDAALEQRLKHIRACDCAWVDLYGTPHQLRERNARLS